MPRSLRSSRRQTRTSRFHPPIQTSGLRRPLAAIGGVLIAIVLDELGIVDLVKYDKENVIGEAEGSAGLSDWLRWTLMGYIVLGILLLLSTFGSAKRRVDVMVSGERSTPARADR